MTDSHATTLDTAMRAAWINAGWPTTANMPADPSAVLAELDARILQTAGHGRRFRMSVARGNLAGGDGRCQRALRRPPLPLPLSRRRIGMHIRSCPNRTWPA